MSSTTPIELERDSALDDDFALDRALRIVKIFTIVWGKNKVARRYLDELTDILIAVKQRARLRHQAIEARRIEQEYVSQVL